VLLPVHLSPPLKGRAISSDSPRTHGPQLMPAGERPESSVRFCGPAKLHPSRASLPCCILMADNALHCGLFRFVLACFVIPVGVQRYGSEEEVVFTFRNRGNLLNAQYAQHRPKPCHKPWIVERLVLHEKKRRMKRLPLLVNQSWGEGSRRLGITCCL